MQRSISAFFEGLLQKIEEAEKIEIKSVNAKGESCYPESWGYTVLIGKEITITAEVAGKPDGYGWYVYEIGIDKIEREIFREDSISNVFKYTWKDVGSF